VSLRKKTVTRGGDVRRGYHEEEDGGRVDIICGGAYMRSTVERRS